MRTHLKLNQETSLSNNIYYFICSIKTTPVKPVCKNSKVPKSKLNRAFVALFCLLLAVNPANAQDAVKPTMVKMYANSIRLSTGNYFIRNTSHGFDEGFRNAITQIGISYERKIHKNIFLVMGYSEWNSIVKGPFLSTNFKLMLHEEGSRYVAKDYTPVIDGLEDRYAYKTVFICPTIKYQIGKLPQFVTIGLGPIFNWGANEYLKSYIHASPTDDIAYYYWKDVSYWGAIGAVSYEYGFFNNRIGLGVGYAARYFPERIKIQHDWNLNINLNF